jgi:hypothetical protein
MIVLSCLIHIVPKQNQRPRRAVRFQHVPSQLPECVVVPMERLLLQHRHSISVQHELHQLLQELVHGHGLVRERMAELLQIVVHKKQLPTHMHGYRQNGILVLSHVEEEHRLVLLSVREMIRQRLQTRSVQEQNQ